MLRAEEVTLNLMEDVWASLHLTPMAIVDHTGNGTTGIYLRLEDDVQPDLVYLLDNGRDNLPDGTSLRARYQGTGGPVVFAVELRKSPTFQYPTRIEPGGVDSPVVDNHATDAISWQQKAVEPLVEALREHMRTIRLAAPDNVWPEYQKGKE